MIFEGPEPADYDNVRSLNRAFLAVVAGDRRPQSLLGPLMPPLAGRLAGLKAGEADRLATAPFLLFSFRERDDPYWEQLFAASRHPDLFSERAISPAGLRRLIAAGLGFVWQLARRNPYAARITCGASLHWCDQLAERTLLQILVLAGRNDDLLTLRSAADEELWHKLLEDGVSIDDDIRMAAQMSAFQSVVTRPQVAMPAMWATAACASRPLSLRVADDDD